MFQAVACELFLFADDSCLVYQHSDVTVIDTKLNKIFSNVCDWFVDNKLSIHFGEDKINANCLAQKKRLKKDSTLDIRYGTVHIKQYRTVTYRGCALDENLSGEPTASQVINKSILDSDFCI